MTKPPIRCNQCEAAMINGVFCHETGCPNSRKTWKDGEWTKEGHYDNWFEEESYREEQIRHTQQFNPHPHLLLDLLFDLVIGVLDSVVHLLFCVGLEKDKRVLNRLIMVNMG